MREANVNIQQNVVKEELRKPATGKIHGG